MPEFKRYDISLDKQFQSSVTHDDTGSSIIHWTCLIAIVLLALWVRMDDLAAWNRNPSKAFYRQQPLLIAQDGYYYLSLAKDLQQGKYASHDDLRGVPTPQKRPWPPPLLSLLAVAFATIFSVSLNWSAVLLPPVLGLTAAGPLYLIGRWYGGRIMALVAVGVGLCANYYVYRSSPGWFDTDCMNITFGLLIPYCLMRFGHEPSHRKYFFLAAGLVLYGLFILWWDQARALVTIVSITPLMLVALLYFRPRGKERRLAIGGGIMLLALLVWWHGPTGIIAPMDQLGSIFSSVSNEASGLFPGTGHSVTEPASVNMDVVSSMTTGDQTTLFIGILGIAWMGVVYRHRLLVLLPLALLAGLSLIIPSAFLIFLNPLIALGLGFLAQQIWNGRDRHTAIYYGAPLIAALLCLSPAKYSLATFYWAKETVPIIDGFKTLSANTPQDAVVWAWWDHGYPLRYWAQRATINDRHLHSVERTVCNALPLAAPSQQLSANFISFYATRGVEGLNRVFEEIKDYSKAMVWIENILTAGPRNSRPIIKRAGLMPEEQWHEFFFPRQQRELYLFLDLRDAQAAYGWYRYGTWDFARQDGRRPQFTFIENIQVDGKHIKGSQIEAYLGKGLVTYRQKTYAMARSYLTDGANQTQTKYTAKDGLIMATHKKSGTAALMDQSFARSTFSQLYALWSPDPAYFTLVAADYPHYQIWKVTPDGHQARASKTRRTFLANSTGMNGF